MKLIFQFKISFFSLFYFSLVNSSHFRGAQLSWKPKSDNGSFVTIEFTAKWVWRLGAAYCDDKIISAGALIGKTDYIYCDTGCDKLGEVIGDTQFSCTAYSVSEDWTMGERIFQHSVPKTSNYQVSYVGGDWINLVRGGGSLELRVKLDTRTRPDTQKINSSPVTIVSPVTYIRKGFTQKIKIPWADIDNDYVRCRWAESNLAECGGICKTVSPAVLNSNTCEITFDGSSASVGWYASAIMLEDFRTATDNVPMSAVPLQFLINVVEVSSSCTTPPIITGDRAAGACIAVPFGTTFTERIVVRIGCYSVKLKDIQVIGPAGIKRSSISGINGQYQIALTWTPVDSQIGPNLVCVKALDDAFLSSDSYCFTLLAGITPPALVPGTGSPSGLLNADTLTGNKTTLTWSVKFNKSVSRPMKSSYISFYKNDSTFLFKIDVSISPTVTYNKATLNFETSNPFEPGSYFILIDYGAGLGSEYCKVESDAIKNPKFWAFTIPDITTKIVDENFVKQILTEITTKTLNLASNKNSSNTNSNTTTDPDNNPSNYYRNENTQNEINSKFKNCNLKSFIVILTTIWLFGVVLHITALVCLFLFFMSKKSN